MCRMGTIIVFQLDANSHLVVYVFIRKVYTVILVVIYSMLVACGTLLGIFTFELLICF